ncbi:MAG: metalloregulator ArsR/SmtB family transcription factor [Gammaproteobacteria bacterium]|nr:metalloregulator ArsR/SmtB family transcription factor [Gammaproteobacteria bacterium]MDH3415344.1 metalloregulator ArsR/SmtB family transcription factor [Gammaproteobacteria bacterium]
MNAEKNTDKQRLIQYSADQMSAHAADAASLMKALGNESRLMVLCMLADGERSVGDLNASIPLSQSALSQQLARLRQQDLVTTRRESQTIYYSLVEGPADRIIRQLHDIYCVTGLAGEKEKH